MSNQQTLKFEILDPKTKTQKETRDLKLQVKCSGANYLVHKAITIQEAKEREFTASTKTRAEVRGGGRKPWKQKGTGRARAGSNRSPLWKGGGVIFGPKPKTSRYKLNKKEKRLAIQTLLANKIKQISVLEDLNLTNAKTSSLISLLNTLELNKKQNILIVTKEKNLNLELAARNLQNVHLIRANQITVKHLLLANHVLMDAPGLEKIVEIYANNSKL